MNKVECIKDHKDSIYSHKENISKLIKSSLCIYDIKDYYKQNKEVKAFFENMPFAIPPFSFQVRKPWFQHERQPTKSDLSHHIIYIRSVYPINEDICAWIIHEIGHQIFYSRNGRVLDQDYPQNKEEKFAFGLQFIFLKEKGVPQNVVFKKLSEAYDRTFFIKIQPYLQEIWNQSNINYLQDIINIK